MSEGSAAYRVISSLPREDGPGLGLGEGEVFQIGLVQMTGQGPQICCLRVQVLHVRRELGQQFLLLGLRHPAKSDGWERKRRDRQRTTCERPTQKTSRQP